MNGGDTQEVQTNFLGVHPHAFTLRHASKFSL